MQFKAQFPPAAFPPSRPLSVKLISGAPAGTGPVPSPAPEDGRTIQFHFRPRFHECLSDCRNSWAAVSVCVHPIPDGWLARSLTRSVFVGRC